LATYFKEKLKNHLLNQIYSNKSKLEGINPQNKDTKEKIYSLYIQTFKKGLFNLIKKEYDPYLRKRIRRRYIGGGFSCDGFHKKEEFKINKVSSGLGIKKVLWKIAKPLLVKLVVIPLMVGTLIMGGLDKK
jgi:hypothetical protein